MQIITVITQAMDMARRKFTRGEQSMLIDIFNGTALTPSILGQHLIAQVEDSFDLYPGQYEEKWGTDRKEMLDKIVSLDPVSAAALELWAVGFWAVNKEAGDLESYLSGRLNLEVCLAGIIDLLRQASNRLEGTKGSFKSAPVGQSREIIDKAAALLSGII